MATQPLAQPTLMTHCPICNAAVTDQYLRAHDHASHDLFELDECGACGLVFVANPPEDLGRYYRAPYRNYRPWVQKIFNLMYRRHARKWSRDIRTRGRALEIGCGDGWMLAALRDEGWQVAGIERTTESASFAVRRQHLPVMVGGLDALKPVPSFDLIFMHHVLEHLPNPMDTLRKCARLLKTDGVLIVAVPNLASWQSRLTGRHWFHLDAPRHLVNFTPATLAQAMQSAGLRVQKLRFVSLDQDPFGWMVSLLNCLGFPQTRWLHWLAGHNVELTFRNVLMLLLSPPLLFLGFVLAPLSWIFRAGACMEMRAQRVDLPDTVR
jgi:SAM-dependent methyltransferase